MCWFKLTSSYSKVDFMVLDKEEDREVPLILRRAFLATGQALIDAENWELTLHVGNEELRFNLYQCMAFLDDEELICMGVAICLHHFMSIYLISLKRTLWRDV